MGKGQIAEVNMKTKKFLVPTKDKGKRVWEALLTKDSWFGTGVGESSTYYSKVTVVAHWHGVTLAFGRKDGSDHLCIYLEPEDARAIGKELVKKAKVVDGIHVMARLTGKYDENLDYKI